MSAKHTHKPKKPIHNFRPLLFLGLFIFVTVGIVALGYFGYGPATIYFEKPAVNLLLIDDDPENYITQTPGQDKKGVVTIRNLKTGKKKIVKIPNAPAVKPPSIPTNKLKPLTNQTTFQTTYGTSVQAVSQIISSCQNSGKTKGEDLRLCMCTKLNCTGSTVDAAIAKAAKDRTGGDGKIDCVELLAIAEQMVNNPLTACSSDNAKGLSYERCSAPSKKDPSKAINNFDCNKNYIKNSGFKVGDDIRENVPYQVKDSDHVSICTQINSDGSCTVCEANRNKQDGKVNCDRKIYPNDKNILNVWRKYDDGSGQCRPA